jgi:hypothetical protein
MIPDPLGAKEAPLPTVIKAEVLVPLVMELKEAELVMVMVEPEFAKLIPVPAAILRAPCVAFEVPLVENIEGRLEALMVPVIPVPGTLVAEIVPEPLVVREAPLPTTIAAEMLVPLLKEVKDGVATVFVMVWFGKLPEMLIPVPATKAGDEVPVPPFAIGTMAEEANEVATMVPEPLVAKEEPVPTTIAAEMLVPEITPAKERGPLVELIVTLDPEFTKLTLEPAMRFKAPWVPL